MKPRILIILGSTGSIGRSTLDVVAAHPDRFEVRALAAFSNVDRLVEQYHQFNPKYLCLVDESRSAELAERLKDEPVEILSGENDLIDMAALRGPDMVVNAVVGAAGLKASLRAVEDGKDLALANKESLVAGGPLFPPIVEKTGARILPIDSEHSAIWQVLHCGKKEEIRRLLLTASGGPFRDYPAEKFAEITVEQALDHPTWNMGNKITIDSATLANKGLEVIEAVQLFDVPADKVTVVVHPQSIVHSMVEFVDSSVVAQLSQPDMRLPITYALFWPDRVESAHGRIDWSQMADLTFEDPDFERFPALRLAIEAARAGGTMPAVFNAANEAAVAAFLDHDIRFTEISETIRRVIEASTSIGQPSLDDILEADREARRLAKQTMETIAL
ncbi:1-deoxy-D-xylulose-5-phosphate reductoisomerase [candidate division GN15 bacterium]|nr:1-deoxy-D-xylulose-5-phosphate reductoisomerase [candidate division GN15 bacterium]